MAELHRLGLVSTEPRRLAALGFDGVHVSRGEDTFAMALRVGRRLLERGLVAAEDVDLVVCCHTLVGGHLVEGDRLPVSGAEHFKFNGSRLLHELGIPHATVIGLSQLTCASFVAALRLIDALAGTDARINNALILAAERLPDGEHRETAYGAVLCDGSMAALVSRDAARDRVLGFASVTRGFLWDWERRQEEMTSGFHPATRDLLLATLADGGLGVGDLGLIVPVNINRLSWEFFARMTELPPGAVLTDNVSRFGHAMGCDSGINLADAVESARVREGDVVVLLSVGLGGHWHGAVLRH